MRGRGNSVAAVAGPFRCAARWAFSFPAVLMCGLAVLMVLTVRDRFNDPDMWWHLKVGEIIWNTHSIPRTDIFSYTTGNHAWVPHEWLAQLSIYAAYKLGGYTGMMVWLCVFGAALAVLVYVLCWMRSGNAKTALAGGLIGWFFATVGLAIRPLMVGHLFLVLELLFLEIARARGRRWLWVLPPLFMLWVNCHGSYALGLMVLGIHAACSWLNLSAGALHSAPAAREDRMRLAFVTGLCALALLANPVGPKLLLYPLNVFVHQTTGLGAVDEWQALDLQSERGIGLLAVMGLVSALLLLGRAKLSVRDGLLLLLGAGMAIRHMRLVFAFGILAAPIVVWLPRNAWDIYDPRRDRRAANAVLILLCAGVIAAAFPREPDLRRQIEERSPAQAVAFVRDHALPGPMLNDYVFGGYLIWALPEHKVFIDGRADVFDWTGVFAEYGRWALLQQDPEVLLDRYGINFCMLRPGSMPARLMNYLPGWRKAYSGEQAVIFVRREIANHAALATVPVTP